MKAIRKEYARPFILEATKLTRLVEVIHDCLGSNSSPVQKDKFEVFLRGNRVEEVTTLEEVLQLENSRENAIKRLVLTSSASSHPGAGSEDQVQVDFDSRSESRSPSGSTTTTAKILVSVRSDSPGWASRTLSDVEEQVDRTPFHDLGQRGALGVILVLLLVLFVALFARSVGFSRPTDDVLRTMWLEEGDIDRLEKMLATGKTLTEEQMREIMTIQLRNVLNDQRPSAPATVSARSTKETVFMFLPLSIVAAAALYLLLVGYPSALFLWGDAVGRYETLRQTRTLIWSIVIGTTVVGVLTNVFKEGLMSWLSRQ